MSVATGDQIFKPREQCIDIGIKAVGCQAGAGSASNTKGLE